MKKIDYKWVIICLLLILTIIQMNEPAKIVDKIIEVSPYENEIIIIDDFSTDGSREILSEIEKGGISKLILNN